MPGSLSIFLFLAEQSKVHLPRLFFSKFYFIFRPKFLPFWSKRFLDRNGTKRCIWHRSINLISCTQEGFPLKSRVSSEHRAHVNPAVSPFALRKPVTQKPVPNRQEQPTRLLFSFSRTSWFILPKPPRYFLGMRYIFSSWKSYVWIVSPKLTPQLGQGKDQEGTSASCIALRTDGSPTDAYFMNMGLLTFIQQLTEAG